MRTYWAWEAHNPSQALSLPFIDPGPCSLTSPASIWSSAPWAVEMGETGLQRTTLLSKTSPVLQPRGHGQPHAPACAVFSTVSSGSLTHSQRPAQPGPSSPPPLPLRTAWSMGHRASWPLGTKGSPRNRQHSSSSFVAGERSHQVSLGRGREVYKLNSHSHGNLSLSQNRNIIL